MLGDAVIGQYRPGDSVIHRLDARVKIVIAVLFIAFVFIAPGMEGLVVMTVVTGTMVGLSQFSLKVVWRSIKPLLFIIIITMIVNLFFAQSGAVLVHWAFITITEGSLYSSIFLSIRLLLLLFGISLLTLTTSPLELCDGGESLMKPLARIGFPAHEFAMMMSIVLRFIPVFVEEGRLIRRSQVTRGADFGSGGLLARAKSVIPLLVPLFASAIRHADGLSQAMESRCYHGGEGRTRMHVFKMQGADYRALVYSLLMLACLIGWRVALVALH